MIRGVLAAASAATDGGSEQPSVNTRGCDETSGAICDWFLDRTGSEWLANIFGLIVPDILRVVGIFAVAWIVNRFARRLIRRAVRRSVRRDHASLRSVRSKLLLTNTGPNDAARSAARTETLGMILQSIATITIYSVAFFIALASLASLSLDLGPLLAGAGIVGVALGFGAQSLVKDFLSGIFMLLEDWYGVGDIIDVGPASGVVEDISLRSTSVRDVDGTLWHVPNGEISRIGNKSQLWSRALLDISVAYDTDLEHAIAVIQQVGDELHDDVEKGETILERPEVWGVEGFGPNEILIRIVFKVVPAQQWEVARAFRLRLKQAFDREGITIPFPQRTVWFHQAVEADSDALVSGRTEPEREPSGGDAAEAGGSDGDADDSGGDAGDGDGR